MKGDQFSVVDTEKARGAALELPRQLLAIQESLKVFLQPQLSAVFDHVDDTFFDLADQADNNRHQTVYFDAMRLIRVQRKAIEHHFFNTLVSNFFLLTQDKSPESMISDKARSNSGLAIVEDEALEEIIALDTMVSKVAEHCKSELEALSARVDSLVPVVVTAKNNPVGPDAICEAFAEAVVHLSLAVPAKLVFFKLFDRHVMTPLGEFLVQANQQLKELGVLPDFESKKKSRLQSPKRPPNKPPLSGTQAESENAVRPQQNGYQSQSQWVPKKEPANYRPREARYGKLISQLQNMMRWGDRPETENLAGENHYEESISAEQLGSMMTEMQSSWLSRVSESSLSNDSLLALFEEAVSREGGRKLGQTERGMIDLLDRLFLKVNTESIASPKISGELRKLELPVLQVALEDATFFDREKHPVRRLLNEIAEAAIGYAESENVDKDPVVQAIEQISDQFYRGEPLDNAALTQLLLNFIDMVEKERRRVAVLEQRLMEEVAAAERVNQAHEAVIKILMERVIGKDLPRFMVDFVEKAWSRVLFLTYLKAGVDSELWNIRVRLLDQLFEFVVGEQPGWSIVCSVIEAIQEQLEDIAYDPNDMGQIIDAMEAYFQNGGTQDALEDLAGGDVALGAEVGSLLQGVRVQSISIDIPGTPSASNDEDMAGIDDQAKRQAEKLSKGAWVEFDHGDQPSHRCKVAGIVAPSGKFVFVNRQGQKVTELHRNVVAMDFHHKKIKHLEKSQLFDQALAGVVDDIRSGREEL